MTDDTDDYDEPPEDYQTEVSSALIGDAILPALRELCEEKDLDPPLVADLHWNLFWTLAYGGVKMPIRQLSVYQMVRQSAGYFEFDDQLESLLVESLAAVIDDGEPPEESGAFGAWPDGVKKWWPGRVWEGQLDPAEIDPEQDDPERVVKRAYSMVVADLLGKVIDRAVQLPEGFDPFPVRSQDGILGVSVRSPTPRNDDDDGFFDD